MRIDKETKGIRAKFIKLSKEVGSVHVGDITHKDGINYYHGDKYGFIHRVNDTIYGLNWDTSRYAFSSWTYHPKHVTPRLIQRDDINGDLE